MVLQRTEPSRLLRVLTLRRTTDLFFRVVTEGRGSLQTAGSILRSAAFAKRGEAGYRTFRMRFLDLTFPTPAENLACDDALLDWCAKNQGEEILRVWESASPFVVLGYGNAAGEEVHLDACRRNRLPVLRRSSGGGTVLQGPGCLNYSLILCIPDREDHPLRSIAGTNSHVTGHHARALRELLGGEVQPMGLSDLAIGLVKFSGNAQRRRKDYLLAHGTILRDFDLPLIDATLAIPKRQPNYRANRPHREFLINTRLRRPPIVQILRNAWSAHTELASPPWQAIDRLSRVRYAMGEWTVRG